MTRVTKTPEQVTNLLAWHDLSDEGTITLSSGTVAAGGTASVIADKSGNGYDLVVGNAACTFVAGTDQATPPVFGNGQRPHLHFTSNQNMVASDIEGPSSFMAFLVMRIPSGYTSTAGTALSYYNTIDTSLISGGITTNAFANEMSLGLHYSAGGGFSAGNNLYRRDKIVVYRLIFDAQQGMLQLNDEPPVYGSVPVATALNAIGFGWLTIGWSFDIYESVVYGGIPDLDDQQAVYNFLAKKHQIQDLPYDAAFGDSITFGVTQAGTVDAYMMQVLFGLGRDFYNFGVSETTMPHKGGLYPDGKSMADNSPKYLRYLRKAGKVHVQYGTNDTFYNFYTNIGSWKKEYLRLLREIIDAGVDPANILIATPPYNSNIAAGLAIISTAVREVCSLLGCTLVEFQQGMITAGLDCAHAGGDNIHPNDAISTFLYNTISPLL